LLQSFQIPIIPPKNKIEFVLKNTEFDEKTILLGHSLGAVVALKVVEKLKINIAGLVLAAGFTQPKFLDHERPFTNRFDWNFNFKSIKEKTGFIKVLRAINDYAVPAEEAKKLVENLDGELIEVKANEEHFCGEKEPIILKNLIPAIEVFTTRPDTLFGATFWLFPPNTQLLKPLFLVLKTKKK